MDKIILASGSPRRKELMALLPWAFEVFVKEVDERLDDSLTMQENMIRLALKKAKASMATHPHQWVIGADTMVVLDGEMLGKPRGSEDAAHMLRKLSGRQHQVITSVGIVCGSKGIEEAFCEETKVTMQPLTEQEIQDYIATGEPLDKAGSYAIQGIGARFIEGIQGDYFNVVGLPVHRLYRVLSQLIK